MTDSSSHGPDPIRLLADADAPATLRRDLSAAARHQVAYDASAGAARFEASLAEGAGGAASSGWGAGALGLGALLLGGLIGGGVWFMRAPEPEPPRVVAGGPRGEAPFVAPTPTPVVIPGAIAPAESAAPQDMLEETDPAPARPPRVRARRATPEAADRPAAEQTISGADYLREAKALQAARGFLGRDPAQALARAEAGAAEFPAGAFAQEWEGVAILALFELERRSEAERRANAFLGRYPKGPYAAQVREALGRE